MISVAVATGTGKHLDDIPPQKRKTAIRINLAENCVSLFSFTVPKLAIGLLLVRILGLLKGATVTLIGLAVILNLFSIVQSIVLSLETDPEISMKTAIGLGCKSAGPLYNLQSGCQLRTSTAMLILNIRSSFCVW